MKILLVCNNSTTIFKESIIRKESDLHGVHCNANVNQKYGIFCEVSIALFFDRSSRDIFINTYLTKCVKARPHKGGLILKPTLLLVSM